jgi:hypothetical protein
VISAAELGDAFGLGRVRDEELVGLFGSVFSFSQTESGNRVNYFHPEQGHALDVVYGKHGRIVRCEPGPALTDELIATLRERVEAALAPDTGFEVRRDVLFSVPEVKGFWRHGDDWQILPAPASAPRPGFLMGEHPFVLEYRVRRSASFQVTETRRWRRFWELHLLLSLLLHGRITRELHAHPHHWVLLHEPTADGSHTVYANEGYMIAGFVARADDFTDPRGYGKLAVVPDDEYYAQRGIGVDDDVTVPSSFDAFFDRFESADVRTRDQLLRASYWLDTASRAWETSKSLSYMAAINAVETLMPKQKADPCPTCSLDRSPGPTAGFRDFVETYAAAEGADARAAMYRFRSALVHGHRLHTMDLPGAWGALARSEVADRNLHDTAFAISRTAVRTWFLDPTACAEAQSHEAGGDQAPHASDGQGTESRQRAGPMASRLRLLAARESARLRYRIGQPMRSWRRAR